MRDMRTSFGEIQPLTFHAGREKVGGARDGPLEHLLLAEDLDHLALDGGAEAAGDALDPVRRRLAAADHAVQEQHATGRERQRDSVHQQADNQHHKHLSLHICRAVRGVHRATHRGQTTGIGLAPECTNGVTNATCE